MDLPNWAHDPKVLKHVHASFTIFWIIMAIPTVLWWKQSILWIAIMSVWANVAGHWSAYQAARAEAQGEED